MRIFFFLNYLKLFKNANRENENEKFKKIVLLTQNILHVCARRYVYIYEMQK